MWFRKKADYSQQHDAAVQQLRKMNEHLAETNTRLAAISQHLDNTPAAVGVAINKAAGRGRRDGA